MLKKLSFFLEKHQTIIFRCFFLLWASGLLISFWQEIINYAPSYFQWNLSDWMINYEGGFIRRGLMGEFLYLLYQCTAWPVNTVVLLIMSLTFIIVMWLLIDLFKKEGWSYFILLSQLLVIPAFCMIAFWTRRDYLLLILTWGIFVLYYRTVKKKRWSTWNMMQLLSVLTLLIHEASFFYTFPILFFHYCATIYNKGFHLWESIFKSIIFFLPELIVMGLIWIYKGDETTADAIWASWEHCIQNYPYEDFPDKIGLGVEALTWDVWWMIKRHLQINFTGYFYRFIPSFPLIIYNFIAIYYLVTRMNTIDLKWNKLKSFDREQLSNLLLLQFIFMLPLFTILSCDGGRVIPYWIFSTLFAFHYFKNDKSIFPCILTRMSQYLQTSIDKYIFLNNPWVYFFILFSIPIPFFNRPVITSSTFFAILRSIWLVIKPYLFG